MESFLVDQGSPDAASGPFNHRMLIGFATVLEQGKARGWGLHSYPDLHRVWPLHILPTPKPSFLAETPFLLRPSLVCCLSQGISQVGADLGPSTGRFPRSSCAGVSTFEQPLDYETRLRPLSRGLRHDTVRYGRQQTGLDPPRDGTGSSPR